MLILIPVVVDAYTHKCCQPIMAICLYADFFCTIATYIHAFVDVKLSFMQNEGEKMYNLCVLTQEAKREFYSMRHKLSNLQKIQKGKGEVKKIYPRYEFRD